MVEEIIETLIVKEFSPTTIGTSLKNSDDGDIKCDGFIQVHFGAALGVPVPYYIPVYDTTG